ncbi:MAG TPA: hypothetical protein VFP84_26455 [Kofleriaceae bacterium]|nr:hypothetical protein [Kofleriaceae bacterium]
MRRALLLVPAILLIAGVAHAYPQYQLARDATCTSCHLSPSGGGLLNENGLAVAESAAQWGVEPSAFLHGALDPPSWLQLGGDARAATGLIQDRGTAPAAYPMQGEVYATAASRGFSFNVVAGVRAPLDGGSPLHVLWSREHYLMWQSSPDSAQGLYVRVGRFMPVFGLRLAEHPVYTERYGGLPLFGEAYGAAVEYVTPAFEVHATGFVHDPIATAVEHGDGGAFYGELRITEHGAIGAEAKYSGSDELHTTFAGVTGKVYVPGSDLLLQTELEIAHDRVIAGGSATRLMGYVLATKPITASWLLDIGLGHYTQDTAVAGLYRDGLDVNVHWFSTSHIELLLNTRLEALDHGAGPIGGYALLQLHYRL